jgi:amino acid permease
MSATLGMVSWAAIFTTYLRFRKAYLRQGLNDRIVPEAKSILQPYLAIYGLIGALLLGKFTFSSLTGSCVPRVFNFCEASSLWRGNLMGLHSWAICSARLLCGPCCLVAPSTEEPKWVLDLEN